MYIFRVIDICICVYIFKRHALNLGEIFLVKWRMNILLFKRYNII